jgi:tetratricopeptide (TPR) repeat protein
MRRWLFSAALLALAVSLSFYPILRNQFILWDNQDYILLNPHIQSLNLENLWWMLTSLEIANWHPFTWLSHAVDYAAFESRPAGHHATNLLLHWANSVWLLWLIPLLFAPASAAPATAWKQADSQLWLAATLAALLFAVHPQRVEVVAWAAERKELLCLYFWLGATTAYVFYARGGHAFWLGLALLGHGLALMSKPMAVTLPAILLLLDLYPLRRLDGVENRWQRLGWLLLEKIPFGLLSLAAAATTILAQAQSGSVSELAELGLLPRLLNACHSLFFYLAKAVAPLLLLPFYPYPDYHGWQAMLPPVAAGLAGLAMLALWWRGHRAWPAAALFYVITLLPVLGLVQVGLQAAADRYTYLPMLPFYVLAGFGAARLMRLGRWRMAASGGVALLLAGLMSLSHQQSLLWRNGVTLWGYAALFTPASDLVQANLGAAYALAGHYAEGIKHLENSVRLQASEENYRKLATVYGMAGQVQRQIAVYLALLRQHQQTGNLAQQADLYQRLSQAYARVGDSAQAAEAARMALQLAPRHNESQEPGSAR